jgi:uncharacterized DUF497 family protein
MPKTAAAKAHAQRTLDDTLSSGRGKHPTISRFTRDIAAKCSYTYNVHMDELSFRWDPKKEKLNVKNHGVSFSEATTAFYDEQAIQFFDPDHSEEEDRFILMGFSFKLRVLVVCHCYRESEEIVRLISARKANTNEEQEYWRRRS